MQADAYKGPERRTFIRLKYARGERPTLTLGRYVFEILELSEQGLRILCDRQTKFKGPVRGVIQFSGGDRLEVEGRIIWEILWEEKYKIGVSLVTAPIPAQIIQKEKARIQKATGEQAPGRVPGGV